MAKPRVVVGARAGVHHRGSHPRVGEPAHEQALQLVPPACSGVELERIVGEQRVDSLRCAHGLLPNLIALGVQPDLERHDEALAVELSRFAVHRPVRTVVDRRRREHLLWVEHLGLLCELVRALERPQDVPVADGDGETWVPYKSLGDQQPYL